VIKIPLPNKGMVALVDDCDAHLARHRWRASGPRSGVFYAVRNKKGGRGDCGVIYLHREVMGLARGDPRRVDHEKGNGLDCRRDNLRIATPLVNSRNKKRPSNNSSGYTGVAFHSRWGRWRAFIGIEGKSAHLGYFDTPELAAYARAEAEVCIYGVQPQRAAELDAILGPITTGAPHVVPVP
jgi:hypothetical protein